MANQLNCLRCGTGMRFIRREKFQLGQTGWVLGDLPNLFAGAMEIEIYVCPKCGKLEFFQPGSDKFAGTANEAEAKCECECECCKAEDNAAEESTEADAEDKEETTQTNDDNTENEEGEGKE